MGTRSRGLDTDKNRANVHGATRRGPLKRACEEESSTHIPMIGSSSRSVIANPHAARTESIAGWKRGSFHLTGSAEALRACPVSDGESGCTGSEMSSIGRGTRAAIGCGARLLLPPSLPAFFRRAPLLGTVRLAPMDDSTRRRLNSYPFSLAWYKLNTTKPSFVCESGCSHPLS